MSENTGKLLRVNLSTGKVERESVDMQDARDFIGGRGLGIKYLYKELTSNIDPLSDRNKLIMLTGVLTGTQVHSASRWLVVTKSPLTGCFARSVAGGDFGAWLKFAGYDLLIIEGKAEKPVYLSITPEGCQIEKGDEIWGRDTKATQEWLRERYGKEMRVACIGVAGENLVRYASIITARRAAGRCGTGAVMGSKNLKAVVIKAHRNIHVHNPEDFQKLVKEQIESIRNNPGYLYTKEFGTTDAIALSNLLGVYPVKNFRYGMMAGYEKLSADEYKKLRVDESGCYSCSARCGKIHVVSSGLYAGARSEGPEHESIGAFTGPIENSCIESTVAADELCDDLGLDTISTGNCIGFAYELYEKGILTRADTDGLELNYGNHSAMIELIKKIGKREGFGDVLAEGSVRAARYIGRGTEAYTMQVKGLELPAYEPRGLKATGFGYATSSIGGSHANGSLAHQELGDAVPRAVDRFSEEGKADIVIFNQDRRTLLETGVVCTFAQSWGDWYNRLYGKMLFAATGIEEFTDWDYLWKVGERIVNLERAFNVRDGFNRAQDTLPQRMRTEPLHTRGAPGEGQMVRGLEKFLDEYYQLRGWTKEGIPSTEKLHELGLGFVVKDMGRSIEKNITQ